MMNIITCILAVAVALLAAVCLKLCHTIDFKNKALVKFIDENIDLKDAIMDMEIELQLQCDLILTFREKQDDDGNDSGKDSPKGPTTEAVAEDKQ
jgi:hypothetical protein